MISIREDILNVLKNQSLFKLIIGFFFRVKNTFKGQSVKFNLLNHSKRDSLFNFGMKVLVYSEETQKLSGTGWHRDGKDIAYF